MSIKSKRNLVIRRLAFAPLVLMMIPMFQAPVADAETATPMESSCLPANAAEECPSEEAVADDALAERADELECYATAYYQEDAGEVGAECCYLIDIYCDEARGCRN